jgi:hypothetical protein
MLSEIKHFYKQIQSDNEGHRYRSWEHCFKAFGNNELSKNEKSLHLAFYLASWGMYRGSSGLLWKDYTVHRQTVKIAESHKNLRVNSNNTFPCIKNIQSCINDISEYYSGIPFHNGKYLNYISATPTLISKIMLGIFGVIPAFDRYFCNGAKVIFQAKSFSFKNIDVLYAYAIDKMPEIEACQAYIFKKSGFWYPPMKILDMYFWQIGFNLDNHL